ncbi:MAG TPA: diguanylate cyclase [Spirochaetales bacterium]|nr:diguanylate cyclase [Spirochaetales bacterium]
MGTNKESGSNELFERLYRSGKLPSILKGLGVFLKDYASGACVPNTLWADLGYSQEQLGAELWRDLLHPDDRERVLASWDGVYRGEADAWAGEFRIKSTSGEWCTVRHRTFVLERDDAGVPSLTVGVDEEITEARAALESERGARALAESRLADAELLRTAGAVASSTLDRSEALDLVLAQARSLVQFDAAVVWQLEDGKPLLIAARGAGVDTPSGDVAAKAALERRPVLDRSSGESGTRSRLCVPLVLMNRVIGALEFLSDAPDAFGAECVRKSIVFADSAAIALANALRYDDSERNARTDWLSGLGNRRQFEDLGPSCLVSHKGRAGFIMLDLDHFKSVNDTWGHTAGDEVLRAFGACCASMTREDDLVCRYGGEEFAIIMPGASAQAAMEAARRILSATRDLGLPDYPSIGITVSAGVFADKVDNSRPQAELERFMRQADVALYRAKQGGRDRVELQR